MENMRKCIIMGNIDGIEIQHNKHYVVLLLTSLINAGMKGGAILYNNCYFDEIFYATI